MMPTLSRTNHEPLVSCCRGLLILLCVLTLAACSPVVTRESIDRKYERVAAELEVGDRVEAQMTDGRELSFRVREIRPTELVGDTSTDITTGEIITVPYEEIRRLERVDQHPMVLFGRVGAAVVVVIGALLLALVLAWG